METVERLQSWFTAQCDGDWEHSFGIRIGTLDNPGWSVDIDLDETELLGREFPPARDDRSENDWVHMFREDSQLKIRCGPSNLAEALSIFCRWAGV